MYPFTNYDDQTLMSCIWKPAGWLTSWLTGKFPWWWCCHCCCCCPPSSTDHVPFF